jgi:hypothetical protein
MADIFISYAKANKQFASMLANALTDSGCSVWWDRDIEHGEYFDRVIEKEIQAATVVIVVWSVAGRESDWCRAEAAAALEQSKLVPISIERAKPPLRFMHLQTGDFSNWKGDHDAEQFQLLCRDLAGYGIKLQQAAPQVPHVFANAGSALVLRRPRIAAWSGILLGILAILAITAYFYIQSIQTALRTDRRQVQAMLETLRTIGQLSVSELDKVPDVCAKFAVTRDGEWFPTNVDLVTSLGIRFKKDTEQANLLRTKCPKAMPK